MRDDTTSTKFNDFFLWQSSYNILHRFVKYALTVWWETMQRLQSSMTSSFKRARTTFYIALYNMQLLFDVRRCHDYKVQLLLLSERARTTFYIALYNVHLLFDERQCNAYKAQWLLASKELVQHSTSLCIICNYCLMWDDATTTKFNYFFFPKELVQHSTLLCIMCTYCLMRDNATPTKLNDF